MVDLFKAGGLTLGLVVVGALVSGAGLVGCQPQSQPVKVEATVLPPAHSPETVIPALDAEVPEEVATATFALG
jgi:hypothetical protein